MRSLITKGTISALILSGGLITAAPATAQQGQNRQEGLVNVAVYDVIDGDVLSNNTVNVAVAAEIAAAVCGVTIPVAVLAEQVFRTGEFECEGTTEGVVITQRR